MVAMINKAKAESRNLKSRKQGKSGQQKIENRNFYSLLSAFNFSYLFLLSKFLICFEISAFQLLIL
jgi:hypothetical protein